MIGVLLLRCLRWGWLSGLGPLLLLLWLDWLWLVIFADVHAEFVFVFEFTDSFKVVILRSLQFLL